MTWLACHVRLLREVVVDVVITLSAVIAFCLLVLGAALVVGMVL
jgi:hypothetical protein